ncbi:MAG: metallophosphoesterase [Pseudomonadota bacterium]
MPTLAHISDVHLAPLPTPWPTQLLSKRILGFLNWHLLGRKAYHRRETLDALVTHLKTQTYDQIAVTGDIVNLALPQEFAASAPWLTQLGRPDEVSVVPGNHDAYVAVAPDQGIGSWSAYMRSNAAGAVYVHSLAEIPYAGFPYVRIVGDLALIGVASGVPTPPFSAQGTLGEAQRDALEAALKALAPRGLCMVLMIHHPPLPDISAPKRDLTDAPELAALLARNQIHLALHGHNHRNELNWGVGPDALFPVVGVASASMAISAHAPMAQYNLYDFERANDGWRVYQRAFAAEGSGGPFAATERALLVPPPAGSGDASAV